MAFLNELRKMLLEGVAAGSGEPNDLAHGCVAMLPKEINDLQRKAR